MAVRLSSARKALFRVGASSYIRRDLAVCLAGHVLSPRWVDVFVMETDWVTSALPAGLGEAFSGRVLLVDEPEAHLHPSAMASGPPRSGRADPAQRGIGGWCCRGRAPWVRLLLYPARGGMAIDPCKVPGSTAERHGPPGCVNSRCPGRLRSRSASANVRLRRTNYDSVACGSGPSR